MGIRNPTHEFAERQPLGMHRLMDLDAAERAGPVVMAAYESLGLEKS
jgi:hypothetical protein